MILNRFFIPVQLLLFNDKWHQMISEDVLTEAEKNFLDRYNKEILRYPARNHGTETLILKIKPFWCIENKLLIFSILFHPLNIYYKSYKDPQKDYCHKDVVKEIIEWEIDSDSEPNLSTGELEQLIKFFRNLP